MWYGGFGIGLVVEDSLSQRKLTEGAINSAAGKEVSIYCNSVCEMGAELLRRRHESKYLL